MQLPVIRRAKWRLREFACLLAASALVAFALARPSIAQTQPAGAACPPADPEMTEFLEPLTEMMLVPGKSMNIPEMLRTMPPETMAKLAALQKAAADRQAKDWPNLCRYAAENAQIIASGIRPRVVFIGDSITENWKPGDPSLFNATVLTRGIGGQTTPQILLRFYQDVVALRPRVVHIMAGTNDISGNTGPTSDQAIVNNIRAMIDIAKANRIAVVLASITPSKGFGMRPNFDPSFRIAAVNRQLAALAAERRVTYVDYFPPLADGAGGFNAALANDGLHPNRAGYAAMRPLAERAVARAAK